MDRGNVSQVRFDECASRTLDHRALVDPRRSTRAYCETRRASFDHRSRRLVPRHCGRVTRSCGVLRCQEKRRVREISRKAQRRCGDLPGTCQLVAAQTRRFQKRSGTRDAGPASADERRTACPLAVRSLAGSGQSSHDVFQTGGRRRSASRLK